MSAESLSAPIIGIVRHRLATDGRGVTTLVGFHGCPLRCRYCLNPQCFSPTAKREMLSPEALYERVKVDQLYFLASGGGVTFGGGEPLLYPEFLMRFRELCGNSWRLCLETSLSVPRDAVELAAQVADEFIVDCKDTDPDIYRRYTGCDNKAMLDNLAFLLSAVPADSVVVRLPLIPDFNGEEQRQISRERLEAVGVTRFDCFSYVKKQ